MASVKTSERRRALEAMQTAMLRATRRGWTPPIIAAFIAVDVRTVLSWLWGRSPGDRVNRMKVERLGDDVWQPESSLREIEARLTTVHELELALRKAHAHQEVWLYDIYEGRIRRAHRDINVLERDLKERQAQPQSRAESAA